MGQSKLQEGNSISGLLFRLDASIAIPVVSRERALIGWVLLPSAVSSRRESKHQTITERHRDHHERNRNIERRHSPRSKLANEANGPCRDQYGKKGFFYKIHHTVPVQETAGVCLHFENFISDLLFRLGG